MKRPALWTAVALAVVIGALVAVLATRDAAVTKVADSPLLGKPAPEVSGKALDGSTVKLTDLRGRFVVVNFFATWCIPCQQEHPELLRFARTHASKDDARVLQVIFDDDADAARAFTKKNSVEWPVVDDPDGQVALDFGVRGPPESFIVGPDGVVLYKLFGAITDATYLDRLIAGTAR